MVNFENLEKYRFSILNRYGIPELMPENIDIHKIEWIPFNYAKTCKTPGNKGVHFYIDDYQFARLWNRPDEYISLLQKFAAVCTPDFSIYTDIPVAMQIYNHYRKHWLGLYWQMHGIHVVPTIGWSDEKSFDWCLDGEPTNSVISISSVGTQKNKKSEELFLKGCRESIKRLKPTQILWYGKLPEEFDWNVVKIEPHYQQIVRRRENGR